MISKVHIPVTVSQCAIEFDYEHSLITIPFKHQNRNFWNGKRFVFQNMDNLHWNYTHKEYEKEIHSNSLQNSYSYGGKRGSFLRTLYHSAKSAGRI